MCVRLHPARPWHTWNVATFDVHASWISDAEVPDDAVLEVNRSFRPLDEELCTWVNQAEAPVQPPPIRHCWYDGPNGRQAALLLGWRNAGGHYDRRIAVAALEPGEG